MSSKSSHIKTTLRVGSSSEAPDGTKCDHFLGMGLGRSFSPVPYPPVVQSCWLSPGLWAVGFHDYHGTGERAGEVGAGMLKCPNITVVTEIHLFILNKETAARLWLVSKVLKKFITSILTLVLIAFLKEGIWGQGLLLCHFF